MADDNETSILHGRSDLLATLTPGFYVLASGFYVGAIMAYGGDTQKVFDEFRTSLSQEKGQWNLALGLGLALFAYMLGSVARAIHVNWADNLCGRFFRYGWVLPWGLVFWEWRARLWARYAERFPYDSVIAETQAAVIRNRGQNQPDPANPGHVPVCLDRDPRHSDYNWWKLVAAQKAPNAFALCQEYEARVRLFAGMVWASAFGVVAGLVGVAQCRIASPDKDNWIVPVLIEVGISLALLVVYGVQLRHVRHQEVRGVVMAYALAGGEYTPHGPATAVAGRRVPG